MKHENNEILCRVENDAPMGKLMRQHWMPACMSEEVEENDGAPVKVRLLGEDIVVFRDSKGRLGALDEYCPHRRVSLVYGRNEECGLRCLYHGWKFDVDGNVIDMPSEPAEARMRGRLKTKHYPVEESGRFVWVWMGDSENVTPFDPPVWSTVPDEKISIVKIHAGCNWAQVLEGSIDSAHSSSLHSTEMPAADGIAGSTATDTTWLRPTTDKAPKMELVKTPFGFRYAALRKPIENADTHQYIRSSLFIAPYTVIIPPNNQYDLAQMLVPMDDENCMFHWIAYHETIGIAQDAWRKFCGAQVGIDIDKNYRKFRTADNHYKQDREAMKDGSFTGITGIPNQDMAMWESMGPIADRSEDRLGSSDLAIAQFRRIMVAAVKAVEKGEPAIGTTSPRIPMSKLGAFEGVVEKSINWRDVNISEEELSLRA